MKFSIIIPVYNVERWLGVCLDSVLAQTSSDWECICVDDGSTDDSGVLLDQYAEEESRIRVVHQRNGGLCRARNRALDIAKGEWVVFIDSDDLIPPDLLVNFETKIKTNPELDCVIFRPEQIDLEGKSIDRQCNRSFHTVLIQNHVEGILRVPDMWCVMAGPWGRAYRRSVIEEYQIRCIEPYAMSEDGLFNAEFYSVCREIEVDHRVTGYYYRIVPGGLSRINSVKKHLSHFRVMEHCLEFSQKYDVKQSLHFAARKGLFMLRCLFLKSAPVDYPAYAKALIFDERFKSILLKLICGYAPRRFRLFSWMLYLLPRPLIYCGVRLLQKMRHLG